MSSVELQPYDFTKPSGIRSESADELSVWMENVCSLMKEMWSEIAPTERTFTARLSEVASFQKIREKFDPTNQVFLSFVGADEIQTMLVMERPIALACALEMIGDECDQAPDDRDLSAIENSLSELFFESVAAKIGAAWPQKQPIASRIGTQVDIPHRSRDFDPEQVMLVHEFVSPANFGEHAVKWIAPQSELEEMVAGPDSHPTVENSEDRARIQAIALEIPARVTIELGEASVPVADLPRLSVGDLIVLDQRIEEPIAVKVENELKFTAWPGKKGTRHAVQIESVH